MTPLLKRLLGNNPDDRELVEEMQSILQEVRQERERFQTLIDNSDTATERLQQLDEPIAKAGNAVYEVTSRLGDMEQRLDAVAQLTLQIQSLDDRSEALAQRQRQTENHFATVLEDSQRIRTLFEELGNKVDLAVSLRERLEAFLEVEKPFQLLRGDIDGLRGQVEGTGDHLSRLREQHERVMDAHKLGLSKMEALERRREELSRDLQDKERRIAGFEQAVSGIDGVRHTVDEVKREIGTLKALSDLVSQKTAALEPQREAVDRALSRADQLDQAMRQIEVGVRQQQETEGFLNSLQDQAESLRSLHETVIDRSREITQLQREADERSQAVRQDLAAVRDEMKNTVERFDFEGKGLESVSQRVADLRGTLLDFENRFKGMRESSQTVAELKSQTQILSTQLQTFSTDVERIDQDTRKLQGIRRDLDEIGRTVREVGTKATRIEESRPAVEAALGDLERLSSSHAMVKDALEQTQLAHGEVSRVLESQSETRSWLSSVEVALNDVKGRVLQVREMEPTIEAVQDQARRVIQSQSAIESRREVVEDLQRRMAELETLSGGLEEQGRQLQGRMDAAQEQFVGLESHAAEAERLGKSVTFLTSSLEQAERQTESIARAVSGIQERCESVEELAERTQGLKKELDQRQHSIREATKDLQRASKLRQEAATSAQQLDEHAKHLAGTLSSVEDRVERIDTLASELEDRASTLKSVEQRLDLFGDRLAKWEFVEQEIARSLEHISSRQSTVESLKTDLERMFVMAEKTAMDVREITTAHRGIEDSRQLLEDVMGRLREVRDIASALDERRRQMARAEERLARADALLVEVRSGLEALQGQKVLVDQAVEKTGTLRSLLKQAEVMIENLREERQMTAEVQAAVSTQRLDSDDDEEDEPMSKAA
jgi:chromosome segregation ATPase